MSTVSPAELLQLYAREEITFEQVIGHILQNMVKMHKSQQDARIDMDRVMAFVGMEQRQDEDDEAST